MKKSEIRLMGMDELNARLLETRGEYMTLRFQAVSGQLTDTSKLRQMRRLIAKFETIKREKQLEKESEGEA
jgi:large subunit ribosomal protein L29